MPNDKKPTFGGKFKVKIKDSTSNSTKEGYLGWDDDDTDLPAVWRTEITSGLVLIETISGTNHWWAHKGANGKLYYLSFHGDQIRFYEESTYNAATWSIAASNKLLGRWSREDFVKVSGTSSNITDGTMLKFGGSSNTECTVKKLPQ